jgi:acetylglutamate kinase
VRTIVVKIGGRAAEKQQDLQALAREMASLAPGHRFLLVHGGGAEVTAVSKRLGIEAVFENGVRQTSAEEMDIVDMVLAGSVNKRLVRLLRACGLDAVGLGGPDGGTFSGRALSPSTRTAEVDRIDSRLLETLLDAGYLPVISSVSMDADGRGLNINADSVAFALAAHLAADAMVFLSDIPGVLRGSEVLARLTPAEAGSLVDSGVVTGGMIPKVTASLEAISRGVKTVIIGQYEGTGSLRALLEGGRGTRIGKESSEERRHR